jgi:hypothetical protein
VAEEEQAEAWAQEDMCAMRWALLILIQRYYLEAISLLPAGDLKPNPA